MHARMSDLSSSPLSRRGARKAAARLSRLFTGHGSSTIKPSTSSDTLCQAVAAPAAQEASLQDSSSSSVTPTPVTIVLARRVGFGDRITVVGDTQALGCWSVHDGVALQWQEGDVWRGEVSLQPGMHEFKCVTLKADGGAEWELGHNRVVQIPAGSDALMARCEWANTACTTVVATPGFACSSDGQAAAAAALPALQDSQQAAADAAPYHSISDTSLWSADDAEDATAVATVSRSPRSAAAAEHQCTAATGSSTAAVEPTAAPAAAAAPAGPADDSSSCSDVVFVAAPEQSGLASNGKQVSFVSSNNNNSSQQLIPHGSYSQFGPAASSNSEEEMSAYTYDTTSSNSASSSNSSSFEASYVTAAGVPPVPASQQQQQPLTPASLAAAAAAAAAASRPSVSVPEYSLSTDSAVSGGEVEDGATLADTEASSADATAAADQQQQPQPMLMSPSPFSARKPPAYSLLSPISSTSTRPLRGAASSSMASMSAYSSMEVSELLTTGTSEDCGTVNMISSEEGLAIAAEAALLYEQMYDQEPSAAAPAAAAAVSDAAAAVNEQQLLEAGVLQDPLAFEQLMAVEPSVLAAQQQQQQQQLAVQQPQQPDGSVFEAAAEAAAAAAAGSTYGGFRDASADAILSAAAEICALGEDVDASALLPKEDTLPPMALARFAAPAGAEEEAADQQQAQLELLDDIAADSAAVDDDDDEFDQFAVAEDDEDDVSLLQDQAAAAAKGLPGSSSSSFVSASSSSSTLTKDQLPALGLTVTVPSAADKAAVEAARLSAANADAAAAVAAAKPAYQRGHDDLIELPVAQEGLRLVASAHIIPHVDKTHTGGEDAFFISQAGHGAVGVSDGVSAWAEDGIDPGEYSRTLVQYCCEAFEERVMAAARAANKGTFCAKFDPRAVLRYAQQCTCKPGSATVVLAAMQPGGKLHVANLGDCGVKVVRDGKIVHETQPQQHDFNLPYQLSHPRLFPDTDTADSADRYTWDVQEGDIIVAASDGLFDNLWDDELLALLPQGLLGAPPPLDSSMSLTGMDSLGRSAGKKLLSRSRSFAALTRSSSNAGAAAATAAQQEQQAAAGGSGSSSSSSSLPRSRSTSHIASWGAKKLSWGRSKGAKAAAMAAAAGYSLAEDDVFAEAAAAAAAAAAAPPKPASPADVAPSDVARAAELLAAAAAAHAADKEFRSPWSVAAGKAFGLLARLFAKGGKMDDITCVVAVVQDAGKARANAAAAAEAARGPTAVAENASGSPVTSSIGTASEGSSSPVSNS